jgi:hypothetical protein
MSYGIFCPLLGFSEGNAELDAVFGEDLVRFYSLQYHCSNNNADALTGEVSVRYVYHLHERLGWCTPFLFMGSSLFDDWDPSLRRQTIDSGPHDELTTDGCFVNVFIDKGARLIWACAANGPLKSC